ncbi:hypothetical protein ACT4UM_19695, partial [Bacillus sp. SS-TM]
PRVIVDPKNLVDGQYDITFKVLKDKTDEISKMLIRLGQGVFMLIFRMKKWNVLTLIMPQMKNLIASQSG